jgi:hypothetical protein
MKKQNARPIEKNMARLDANRQTVRLARPQCGR